MDAILDLSDPANPREPEWPKADVIIGNPPFLGGRWLRNGNQSRNRPGGGTGLGDTYVGALFSVWEGRVRHEADLCCYWHEKSCEAIAAGRAKRAGLLATQAIRSGANRDTLVRIKNVGDIFFAESSRPWVLDGAAVRVSMVGFDDGSEIQRVLDGRPVEVINANLTGLIDVATAHRLKENIGLSAFGVTVVGPFDIGDSEAKAMLASPNPGGAPNSDVLRRWINGWDITRRDRGRWIIDLGNLPLELAARYELPFKYVEERVKPTRDSNRRGHRRERWWQHGEYAPNLRTMIAAVARYPVTPRVSKHRLFIWAPSETLPDSATVAFARSDDYFFGVLQSRPHELWALAQGSRLEDRPRYTPTSSFDTFPFPWPPRREPQDSPLVAAIAEAARELNALRESWINPPPDSIGESELKKRTLTNLYNERPTWLDLAHRKLDSAVFAAYAWPEPPDQLSDQDILARLLTLNLERQPA
jgi:hypothetical protein